MQKLSPEESKLYRTRYYMKKSNVNHIYGQGQWQIDFNQWLNIWIASGHISQMGSSGNEYVLARIDRTRPFTVDNLHIVTKSQQITDLHRGVSKNRGREFNVGIKRSEETRQRLRDSHKGYKPTPTGTPIQTPQGVFPTLKAAAEHYGVNVTAIHYFKRKYPNEWYYVF